MLAVKLNKANFEYDVHSLVKSFFPEETVKVLTPSTKEETYWSVLEQAGIAEEKDIPLKIKIEEDCAIIFLRNNIKESAEIMTGTSEHHWQYSEMRK